LDFSPNFSSFPSDSFVVDTYTDRLRLSKISKGYGERILWRISSRTVEVDDVLKDDHILASTKVWEIWKFILYSSWYIISLQNFSPDDSAADGSERSQNVTSFV
jgi:hypothetical protein